MDAQKEGAIVGTSDILQKISYDREFTYEEIRDCFSDELKKNRNYGASIEGCVNWLFENNAESMDENGMEKFVIMIAAIFFLMENETILPDVAYGTKWDILDFKTGDYDALFESKDLKQIKSDIEIINSYLDGFPELVSSVEKDRETVQSK